MGESISFMEQYNKPISNDEQLQMALNRISKAVQGEREDELFYDYLIKEAPTTEEKTIITSIRDDERRHNRMFRRIYKDFTDEELPVNEDEAFEEPESYLDGIKKALFGELAAVERYKIIRRMLPGPYKELLFDIITDEMRHATMYNYLFTLNNTMNNSAMNNSFMRQKADTTIDTSNFTPDDWVKYITPLVNRALAEAKGGINPEHLYQEFILAGVLIGLGKNPQEAIEQVEEWENTGTSKLLAMSKMNRYFERQKQFTIEELSQYNGKNGKPVYVAVDGIVYDLSNVKPWASGIHFDVVAGKDLTAEFNSHHGIKKVLENKQKVGILI